ncbi:MAG: DNA double-strand break repair nuclease NurA [Myxococcota bacterium]
MLNRSRFEQALLQKSDQFLSYDALLQQRQEEDAQRWRRVVAMPVSEVLARLSVETAPGAVPFGGDEHSSWCVEFSHRFAHHEEARTWAYRVLEGQGVLAVDGSQLMPDKEFSLPVAAVQAGWFWNPHVQGQAFVKDLWMDILGPEDLKASGSGGRLFHEQFISLQRFCLEVEKIKYFIKSPGRLSPSVSSIGLALFDGSMLVSFAEVLMDLYRDAYVKAARSLLLCSQDKRVPLFGYVDTSLARDLCRMCGVLLDEPETASSIVDADLVAPFLPNWGDRTIAFRCRRPGILKHYRDTGGGLGFAYLRASSKTSPVRVEFPWWMVEVGVLERAFDVLRAELIVGNGYPYALETADQLAWFSPLDRRTFQRWIGAFLAHQSVKIERSNKLNSKARRR